MCSLLRNCLCSIYTFPSRDDFEVIVIDNASHDGSPDMVAKEFPNVYLIRNADNKGFAGGNNQGIKVARGEYIVLLGSDTEVRQDSLQSMIQFLDTHPESGAVSCKLVLPNGELQRSCKRFPSLGNAIAMYCSLHWLNKTYLMHDFDHNSVKEVDQADATCIMIRRGVMNALGGLDERYSILYNDVDLCQRMKNLDVRVYFIPDAIVIHHGSQSTRKAPPALRLEMYHNVLDYYETYVGRYARWMLLPILFTRLLAVTRHPVALKLFASRKAA